VPKAKKHLKKETGRRTSPEPNSSQRGGGKRSEVLIDRESGSPLRRTAGGIGR